MGQNEMIWSYLIHLSTNMWGDQFSAERYSIYRDTNITEDAAWKEVVDFLPGRGINTLIIDLGDAVQYESHPEISIRGAWSKEKLDQELQRLRGMGITPIPKLNFSACHNAWMGSWKRMLSTPQYYDFCRDLIDEVSELFGNPKLFHLGLDEETYENQKTHLYAVIRNRDLWWHDAKQLFALCEKHGARPWVWADAYWIHPEEYLNNMPKDVLQSNWFYGKMRQNEDGASGAAMAEPLRCELQAYLDLDRAGYDQVPTCSTWETSYNDVETMRFGRNRLSADRVRGYMTAPWKWTTEEMKYALLDDAQTFWYARKRIYPETVSEQAEQLTKE